MGGPQLPTDDPFRGELSLELLDVLGRPGDDTEAGSVVRGDSQLAPQTVGDLFCRETHRKHRAFGLRPHEASAFRNQAESVLQLHDARDYSCDELSDTMTDHRSGNDTPGHPELREGIRCDEECRLRDRRLTQRLRGTLLVTLLRKDELPQITPENRRENLGAVVDDCAVSRLVLVEPEPHAHVLRPLAGKQEGDIGSFRLQLAAGND